MDRNDYQQGCAGRSGCAGDDGGHLIAASLGGAGDRINIVPQAATLNRDDWRAMERELAGYLKEGKSVSVKIDVGYPASGGAGRIFSKLSPPWMARKLKRFLSNECKHS